MDDDEKQAIAAKVLEELRSTRYACSKLEPLSGGFTNLVYRGDLEQPLEDGSVAVAVKHGMDHIASNPSLKVPTIRCTVEAKCLEAVSALRPSQSADAPFAIRSPVLYRFNSTTNTQVQEYLPHAIDLKTYCLRHFSSPPQNSIDEPSLSPYHFLGHAMGAWLRTLHSWASAPAQSHLRDTVRSNQQMQAKKHSINFDRLLRTVPHFPDIIKEADEILFTQVRASALAELRDENQLQVIHGDFWTANIILPNKPLAQRKDATPNHPLPIFVLDWEMAQLAPLALDVGQMLAELYLLHLRKNVPAGKVMMQSFASGYNIRAENDDFAFRVAIQIGVHLISFGSMDSTSGGWVDDEQVRRVVALGRDIIVRAWGRDRGWFEGAELRCLFEKVEKGE